MSRFSNRSKSPLPRVGEHYDPAPHVRATLSLTHQSARTDETSVTKARRGRSNASGLQIDTSFGTPHYGGIQAGLPHMQEAAQPVLAGSASARRPPALAANHSTPAPASSSRKVPLTPGQQVLLQQLQADKERKSLQQAQQQQQQQDGAPAEALPEESEEDMKRDKKALKKEKKEREKQEKLKQQQEQGKVNRAGLPDDEVANITASMINSYGKLPLSSRARSPATHTSESVGSGRHSISVDTSQSSSYVLHLDNDAGMTNSKAAQKAEQARQATDLVTKRRASAPGFKVTPPSSPPTPGPPSGLPPQQQLQQQRAPGVLARPGPKVATKVTSSSARISDATTAGIDHMQPTTAFNPNATLLLPELVVYSATFKELLGGVSARWLQLSSSLWSVIVLDSNRNLSKARDAVAGVLDSHSVQQLLQVMKMRQAGSVSDAEVTAVLQAWGIDELCSGATKSQRHLFSTYHFRRLLYDQQYSEADLALFIGIVVNSMSSSGNSRITDVLVSSHSDPAPSPAKELQRPRSWHLAAEQLFFAFDSQGHGLWSYDEMHAFAACLVVGFSGEHDLDKYGVRNGGGGSSPSHKNATDTADWQTLDDARPDLQHGVLTSYAVKLLELMQVCVPLDTASAENDPWAAKKTSVESRYAKFKSSATSDGFVWGGAPDITLAMLLLGPGSAVPSSSYLADEVLPSVEYAPEHAAAAALMEAEAADKEVQKTAKTSSMAAALARRGSILGDKGGSATKADPHPKGSPQDKNDAKATKRAKKAPTRYGHFFVTLPMLKTFLISVGRGASESAVQRLTEHSRSFLRRLNKQMRTGISGSPGMKAAGEDLRGSCRLFHDAIGDATAGSIRAGKSQHTKLLAKFLDSDGHKYLPAKWRAAKSTANAGEASKGADHVCIRRLLVMYQQWVGPEESVSPRPPAAQTTGYFDEDDSEDEVGGLTSREMYHTYYGFIASTLEFYRVRQKQMSDALVSVVGKYYIASSQASGAGSGRSSSSGYGGGMTPPSAGRKRARAINLVCAALLPDIEATLSLLEVADEEESEKEGKLQQAVDEQNAQIAGKRGDGPRLTVPQPPKEKSSPPQDITKNSRARATSPFEGSSTVDHLGLFGPPPTVKGILKSSTTHASSAYSELVFDKDEPDQVSEAEELELELTGHTDASGWAAVSGIGSGSPPGVKSVQAHVRQEQPLQPSRREANATAAAAPAPTPASAHTPSLKLWYRVSCEDGTFIRSAPSYDAENIGDVDYDDILQVTGHCVQDGRLTYMQLAKTGGWIPTTTMRGWEIFEPLPRGSTNPSRAPSPAPSAPDSDFYEGEAASYQGSAPRSRSSTVDTNAVAETSSVDSKGAYTSVQAPAKKSVLHFFQKAIGLKPHKDKAPPFVPGQPRRPHSLQQRDIQDEEDSEDESFGTGDEIESEVMEEYLPRTSDDDDEGHLFTHSHNDVATRHSDGGRDSEVDFDQLHELEGEFTDAGSTGPDDEGPESPREQGRREHQEHARNHIGRPPLPHSLQGNPESNFMAKRAITPTEHALLDALVTAEDPREQTHLIARLKEIRTASKAPTPQPQPQSERERFVSPRTNYLQGFFSSIADGDDNTSGAPGTHRTTPTYLEVDEQTDNGSEASYNDATNNMPAAAQGAQKSEYRGAPRRRSRSDMRSDSIGTPTSELGSVNSVGSIAEMLSQGQSAGKYAHTLRHILREMSQPTKGGAASPSMGGALQMQHLEEVLRLGQAIATQEKQQQQAMKESAQDTEMHPPPRSRTPVGRPPLPNNGGNNRSVSNNILEGQHPRSTRSSNIRSGKTTHTPPTRYSVDPYAFTNRTPKNHEVRSTQRTAQREPFSGGGGGANSASGSRAQKRNNQHDAAFKSSHEENTIRAKIRELELKERRLDRESRTGSTSARRGSYFGAASSVERSRGTGDATPSAGVTSTTRMSTSNTINSKSSNSRGSSNNNNNKSADLGLSGEKLFQESSYHSNTPARATAYKGAIVRGSAAAPGSVQRLGNRGAPGKAPDRSTTKQPKMAFGGRL